MTTQTEFDAVQITREEHEEAQREGMALVAAYGARHATMLVEQRQRTCADDEMPYLMALYDVVYQ